MSETGQVCVMMDDYEQRVVIKSLNEFRNTLIQEELPTEDVEKMLLKVIDAPLAKGSRKKQRAYDRGR